MPEHVRNTLAARAARSGRSLQEYLLVELSELAEQPTADDLMEQAGALAAAAGTRLDIGLLLEVRGPGRG